MTRSWVVGVAWILVVAGAAFGITLASGRAGAETEPRGAAVDQYEAADGSESGQPDPTAPAGASVSSSANASASASASASPEASAPAPEDGSVDGAEDDGSADPGALEDSLEDGPGGGADPSAPAEMSASAPAASSASASASAPTDEEALIDEEAPTEEEHGPPLEGSASASASADASAPANASVSASAGADASADASAPAETGPAAPGELVGDAAAEDSGEPVIQPKAGGPAPPDPHPDGPPPAPFEDDWGYYDSCFEPDNACGLDVPKGYACDMVYEGELEGKPDRYECYYTAGADFRYTEGPNGEECIEKLVYSGRNDEDPETIYDCTGGFPSKKYYLCEYDADWNATRCLKPFKGGNPEGEEGQELPYDPECGADDCGLDVPKRYECKREYWNAGKYDYFCQPPKEASFKSPEGERCWKTYAFSGRNGERETYYYCGRNFGDYDEGWGCPWYNADWEKVKCGPPNSGAGAAGVGALKPSDDAQNAIKDAREEPGGGWQGIRRFGGAVGDAALGFVGFGDGSGDGGGATAPVGSPKIVGIGSAVAGTPEATVPEVTRVEVGAPPAVAAELGVLPVRAAAAGSGDPRPVPFENRPASQTGAAPDVSEADTSRDDGGEVAAAAGQEEGEPEEREGAVPSAGTGGGPGNENGPGGASGGSPGGAEEGADTEPAPKAAPNADGTARGGEGFLSAAIEEVAGRDASDVLGGGGWGWTAAAGSGALVLGGLAAAGMRRRGLLGTGRR